MNTRTIILSLAILTSTVALGGICLYAYRLGSTHGEQKPRYFSQSTLDDCASLADAIPPSGWDAVATIPGTSVTFAYPKEGFYSQPSTLASLDRGQGNISLTPLASPEDGPFLFPSFSAYITASPTEMSESDLLQEAILTEDDLEQSADCAVVEISGHRFLLAFENVSYGVYVASTIHEGQLITIVTHPGSQCGYEYGLTRNQLFLNFLRHMEFNATPAR